MLPLPLPLLVGGLPIIALRIVCPVVVQHRCVFFSLFLFSSLSPHLTSPYLVINGRGSILATATYTARMARSKNNKIAIKLFADIKMKMDFHFYE